MAKSSYQKATEKDRMGIPVRDWHPARRSPEWYANYDRIFRKKEDPVLINSKRHTKKELPRGN